MFEISPPSHKTAARRWRLTAVAILLALMLAAVIGVSATDGPPHLSWPGAANVQTVSPAAARQIEEKPPTVKLVVDTDAGVDDAAAIALLLADQRRFPVEVLGITAVAGNTTVENVANNALALLDVTERTDIPVVIGAAEPLEQPRSHTGSLIHGPDGLWFLGLQNPHDLSALPTDAPAFLRDTAQANPGAKLLALGPLTNIAQAIERYPDAMSLYSEIVILGGAKYGGNQTPVAEYNIWQDPEAARIVLTSGLPLTLVTLDGFTEFTFDQEDIDELMADGTPAGRFLAGPLQQFYFVQTAQAGLAEASLPDVVAAIYAVIPETGTAESALVKVITAESLARGQTVIGLTVNERLTMIASDAELSEIADLVFSDPNFDLQAALAAILMREPDNASFVGDVNARVMHRLFMKGLTD